MKKHTNLLVPYISQLRQNAGSQKHSYTARKVWLPFPLMGCQRRAAARPVAEFYKRTSKFWSIKTLAEKKYKNRWVKSHMILGRFRKMINISFCVQRNKKLQVNRDKTSVNEPETCWHGNFCVTVAKSSWWVLSRDLSRKEYLSLSSF